VPAGDHEWQVPLPGTHYAGQLAAQPADEYVDGLENPAECFHNIIGWLVAHDYPDDDIRKVVGENVLRVLEEVWI